MIRKRTANKPQSFPFHFFHCGVELLFYVVAKRIPLSFILGSVFVMIVPLGSAAIPLLVYEDRRRSQPREASARTPGQRHPSGQLSEPDRGHGGVSWLMLRSKVNQLRQ